MINLGAAYCHQGRYAEADALLRRALEIRLTAFGPESLPVAEVLANQAFVLRHLKRKAEARQLEERALAIRAGHIRANFEGHTVDVSELSREKRR
jgi:Tfp pilus assembly protein PilF